MSAVQGRVLVSGLGLDGRRCVAVSTDVWRTASVPQDGRCAPSAFRRTATDCPDSGVFRLDRRRSVALTGASAIALMARRPSATRGRRRLSMPVWERRAPCRHVGALANEAVAPSGPVWRRLTRGARLGERRHGERLGSGRVPSRGHRRPPVRLRRRFVPPGNRGFRSGCHICLPGSDIRIEGRKHVTRPGRVTGVPSRRSDR